MPEPRSDASYEYHWEKPNDTGENSIDLKLNFSEHKAQYRPSFLHSNRDVLTFLREDI